MAPIMLLATCFAAAAIAGGTTDNMGSKGTTYDNMDSMDTNSNNMTSNNMGAGDPSKSLETVDISIGVDILSSTMGGSSVKTDYSAPAMAASATHQVTVGGSAGLVFSPPTLEAAVGDMVMFTFMSENHTLTQSAFTTPCEKLSGGVDSGFMPNPNNTVSPPPSFMFQVMVATPIWFYCRQKGHCGKGMVFSINPTANKTQAMFQATAIQQNGTTSSSSAGVSTAIAAAYTESVSMASPTMSMMTISTAVVAAAAAAPSAAASMASSVTTSSNAPTISAAPAPVGTQAAAAAQASPPMIASGNGSGGSGEECSCSCYCGVAAFPAGAGMGNFGGWGGALPSAMID